MNTGELVARLLASEVRGDILALFHRNPGIIDTLEGVALRIGKRAESIEEDIKDFVDLGILRARRIGNSKVLSLNRERDRETQQLLAEHVKNSSAGSSEQP